MAGAGPIIDDLAAESDELDALIALLPAEGWAQPTPAPGWTIAHQIAHLLWTDRVALTSVTDEAGFGVLPALMLGTLTAVGGGFVRDMVLRRIPGILGGNTLYATAALLASGVAVGCWYLDAAVIGSLIAAVVGAALVLLARWRRLSLPVGDDVITIGQAVGQVMAKSRRRAARTKRLRDRESDGTGAGTHV